MEVWKDATGFEGIYQVSNFGRIKKIRTWRGNKYKNKYINCETILKGSIQNNGYISISYRGKHYLLHRIIATTFIPNPKNKPQVNHKDGNKLNNSVNNLEWVTNKENAAHARKHGLLTARDKISAIKNSKKVRQLSLDGQLIKEWSSASVASRTLGIDSSAIRKCCRHQRNKCGGYMWEDEKEVM